MRVRIALFLLIATMHVVNAQNFVDRLFGDCQAQALRIKNERLKKLDYWLPDENRASEVRRCKLHKNSGCSSCARTERRDLRRIEKEYDSSVQQCLAAEQKAGEEEREKDKKKKEDMLSDFTSKVTQPDIKPTSQNSAADRSQYAFMYYDNWGYDGLTPLKDRIPVAVYISDVVDISQWNGCDLKEATNLTGGFYNCADAGTSEVSKKGWCCGRLWLYQQMKRIFPNVNFYNTSRFSVVINDRETTKNECKTGNEPGCFTNDKEKIEMLRKEIIKTYGKNKKIVEVRPN